MTDKKLKVLVVGLGQMGKSHAIAYHTHPGFEIVGLVNRSTPTLPAELTGYPIRTDYAAALTSVMSGESYAQSAEIAAKLGPFGGYEVNEEPFLRVIDKHRRSAHKINKKNVPIDLMDAALECWDRAYEKGKEHGFRNAR